MIFNETALQGAYIVQLEPFQDERGLFARTYCKREFAAIGHDKEFVQFNHSHNTNRATLRGMHFQHPPFTEIKLIRCIQGSVYDVIVDLRPHSPTFLQHVGVELTAQNMHMIYIPEGFAHGFQTLEDHSELIYHHTAYYTPGQEGGLRYDDPRLGITWPYTPSVISAKDQSYPLLTDSFEGLVLNDGYF